MVASVIEELSPKDQRSKLLREKLAIIQEAQISTVSAGLRPHSTFSFYSLLKNFGFQPQVLSTVRTAPFQGSHILGPDPKELQNRVRPSGKLTEWLAHLWHLFRNPKRQACKGHHLPGRTSPGPLVFDRLGSLIITTAQRTATQDQPFRAGAGRGACHPPYLEQHKKTNRTSSASSARQHCWVLGGGSPGGLCSQWRSLLGTCRASGIVKDGVGLYFPSETSAHPSCISFRARNSWQHLQQAVDVLLLKRALEQVTNMTSLGYYSRLFLVQKKMLFYMCRCIKLSRSICNLLQFSRLDHKLREVRSHSKSGLPVHRDAVQHSTGHSGALPKMRL